MKKPLISFLFTFSIFIVSNLNAKIYKGAEYRTIETYTYGRFEVSYIPANREGVVSSFFTYHEITQSTGWNEIDIEILGRYSDVAQFNVITPGQKFHIRNQYLNFNPFLDYHTYAFEWTPDYIAWFIDGVEVYRQTGAHIQEMKHPSKLMMNIWNPIWANWVGTWDKANLPANSFYDWAAYYSYSPGSGDGGTDNNFKFEWKDEFDLWDESRWEKATHTFSGNEADFIKENVVFKDGKLILCLTDETNIGYVDKTAPKVLWGRFNYDRSVTLNFSEELDQISAVNKSNYIITGVTLDQIELSEDRKTVNLRSAGINPFASVNVIVLNVLDDAQPANKITTAAKPIVPISTLNFPITINAGGEGLGEFLTDQNYTADLEYGYQMGDSKKYPADLSISGTDFPELFRTERKGMVTYRFRVPDGHYNLGLMFSENIESQSGGRIFNVICEGSVLHQNLDVFDRVGKNSALILQNEIDVKDGMLDIHFEEVIDSAFINGITIDLITTDLDEFGVEDRDFELYQNYPNPFNGDTIINYYVNNPGRVNFSIYNIVGEKVYSLSKENAQSGNNRFTWSGSDAKGNAVNSGVYIYRISSNEKSQSKKMLYLK
ncbi:MAG: family 16 glycosylhydrolase [Bacteroidetes bacterium]|nr:family 16 glycosylhydrolase [Bacteroidota bacterium]